MFQPRTLSVVVLFMLLAPQGMLRAQQMSSHIGYVFPAGGKQGTTVEALVGGQRLDGASEVHISGIGVRATLGELTKPLTQKQVNELREQLDQLTEKRRAVFRRNNVGKAGSSSTQPATRPEWTPADEKQFQEIVKKLQMAKNRKQGNAAIAETIPLRIMIDRNAPPGPRELRLQTATGLSDPLIFCVGQLPEYIAAPFAPVKIGANGQPEPVVTGPSAAPAQPEKPLTLPVVINGQILPGGSNRIQFAASKGMNVVVQTHARTLMPFLSDAVPGWFQAAVSIEDPQGREIAFADHFNYNPDPIFCCEIPADGTYILKVRDSIYRGREDFVYRVTLGELPFITGIFPLGARNGTAAQVQLFGWNLPTEKIIVDTSGKTAGKMPVMVSRRGIESNTPPFLIDNLPECRERLPNDTMQNAQQVVLPIVINGRVEDAGKWHVYRFEGKINDNIVAEVCARRLGSPLDSLIKLTDEKGNVLAVNDDQPDQAAGTLTHDADSYISVKLPASGAYYLYLADAQQKCGPEYAFRLRLSAPRPDFELRVSPAELIVRAGTSVPLTVHAIRKDGFTGDIALSLTKAPPGFVLNGGGIPANQNEIKLTLKAPPAMLDEPAALGLEGSAMISGQKVSRTAIPAEDRMQAFAYHHLVPSNEWLVSVPPQPIARSAIKILSAMPLKLTAKGSAQINAALPPVAQLGKVLIELNNPPEGFSLEDMTTEKSGSVSLSLKYDMSKMMPGYKGNLIFNVYVERDSQKGSGAQNPKRRVPLGAMPAIPFEYVP